MRDCSKAVMKAKCENSGMLLRVVFWGYGIYVLCRLLFCMWMLCFPAECFSVDLMNGRVWFLLDGVPAWFASFPGGMLTEAALESPKLAYRTAFGAVLLFYGIALGILWHVRSIFRWIARDGSPFSGGTCKAIRRIGILILLSAFVKDTLQGLVCTLLGIGQIQGIASPFLLLVGAVVICLSHIFEYGAALQKEVDETL